MKIDDIVYSIDGDEFILVAILPLGYVVKPVYEGSGDSFEQHLRVKAISETFCGSPVFIDKVFFEPPIQKKQAKCEELQNRLEKLDNELSIATRELFDAKNKRDEMIAKISSQNAALSRISDFLDGKITHYVIYSSGNIVILPISEATCESDDNYTKHKNGWGTLKLLTLYGLCDGNLEWQLNQYKDGSGRDTNMYPCVSIEDAKSKASDLVTSAVEKWKNGGQLWELKYVQKSAKKYGISFPKEAADAIRIDEIKLAEVDVERKEKELKHAKNNLELAKVSYI